MEVVATYTSCCYVKWLPIAQTSVWFSRLTAATEQYQASIQYAHITLSHCNWTYRICYEPINCCPHKIITVNHSILFLKKNILLEKNPSPKTILDTWNEDQPGNLEAVPWWRSNITGCRKSTGCSTQGTGTTAISWRYWIHQHNIVTKVNKAISWDA